MGSKDAIKKPPKKIERKKWSEEPKKQEETKPKIIKIRDIR
jgi:hypothetical protein